MCYILFVFIHEKQLSVKMLVLQGCKLWTIFVLQEVTGPGLQEVTAPGQ